MSQGGLEFPRPCGHQPLNTGRSTPLPGPICSTPWSAGNVATRYDTTGHRLPPRYSTLLHGETYASALRRRISRRSRLVAPAETPQVSGSAMAKSAHSRRTGQLAQIALAGGVSCPAPVTNIDVPIPREAAWRCHTGRAVRRARIAAASGVSAAISHQPSDLELVHRLPMVPWRTIEDVDRMPLPWRYQRWTCGHQKVSGWLAVILATGGEVAGPILLHWGVGPRAGCVRISAGPATSVGRDDDRHPSHPRTGSLPSSQGPTGMRWPAPPLMRSASGVGPLRVVRPLCGFRMDWPYSSPMALGDHASRGAATFWRRRPSMYHPGAGAGPEIPSRSRAPSPVSVPIQAAYSTRLPSASWRECLSLGTASLKRSPSSRESAGPWPTRNRPLVLTEGRRAVLAGLEHFGRAVARRLGPTHGLAPRLVVSPLKSVASSTRSRNANRSWSTDDDRRLVFQQRTGQTPSPFPSDPPGKWRGPVRAVTVYERILVATAGPAPGAR